MAATFKFYSDANLTTEISGNLVATQNQDGSTGPIVFTVYYGSATASRVAYNKTNQGVEPLFAEVVDSNPTGGHPATEIKLASTLGGLASAVGGAPLSLGTSILSGVANKKTIFVQIDDSTHVVSNLTELSVQVKNVRELAV